MRTSTLNVNLKPCTCHPDWPEHHPRCPGAPVLVPCPVRRSVTFSVTMGACTCTASLVAEYPPPLHQSTCPARPVNVTCSIKGETWAESEVDRVETYEPSAHSQKEWEALESASCARWAIVKALVLGTAFIETLQARCALANLYAQRDTVFAALADMARAEQDACDAQQRVDDVFPFARFNRNYADHRAERPSVGRLAAYVDFLIASVNTL